jgi:chaperone required for assembly of F1-ATPase
MTSNNGETGPDLARPDLAKLATREAPPPKAKRFYREATVARDGDVFRVHLDGRPVKTPLQKVLAASSEALAEAIAAEWRGQGSEIDPTSMPLTRLTATALDRVGPEREAIVGVLLPYVETDLLCYRAASPKDLKARQQAQWQPVVEWMAVAHDIVLTVTDGIMPVVQPQTSVDAAGAALARLSDDLLTALQAAVGATGSFGLGLALVHGRLSAAEAIAATHLDETYQNEQWGEDTEALERRRRISAEIEAIGRYLSLIGPAR